MGSVAHLNVAAAADDNILASTVGGGGHLAIAGCHQVHIDVGAHEVALTCWKNKTRVGKWGKGQHYAECIESMSIKIEPGICLGQVVE